MANILAPLMPAQPQSAHSHVLERQKIPRWERWAKIGILAMMFLLIFFGWKSGAFVRFTHLIPKTHVGTIWFWSVVFYGFIHYAAMLWRVWLWLGYRPFTSIPERQLPTVSVIIPAYNEGALVQQCISSVFNSDYPEDKLQVIVVDDGSEDDTWKYIRRATAAAPVKTLTLRRPENRGKRHALYEGFQRARGEVWVTVDSDSILEPDALRKGVSPLVRDPRIGLVAGCVKVLNRNDSLITRFLKTSFSLSFKFSRAYQSQIRGLLTTPGALSIYRASVVKPVLEKWLRQTFLGVPCLTGEDRSMTNLITAQGFHSFFQSNAVVWSQMPASYSGMVKMFLRWARSNIRETTVLFSFLFTRFRPDYVWGFRINSVIIASTLVVPYLLMIQSYSLILTSPLWALRHFAIISFLGITMAIIYCRNERDSDFLWVILYEFFWVLSCQWIMPYAFLTCRRQGVWITREIQNKSVADVSGSSFAPQNVHLNDMSNLEPVAQKWVA